MILAELTGHTNKGGNMAFGDALKILPKSYGKGTQKYRIYYKDGNLCVSNSIGEIVAVFFPLAYHPTDPTREALFHALLFVKALIEKGE
jgi:hypothetical protein